MLRLRIFPGVSATLCIRVYLHYTLYTLHFVYECILKGVRKCVRVCTKVCTSIQHTSIYTGMRVNLRVWYMNTHMSPGKGCSGTCPPTQSLPFPVGAADLPELINDLHLDFYLPTFKYKKIANSGVQTHTAFPIGKIQHTGQSASQKPKIILKKSPLKIFSSWLGLPPNWDC